MRILFFVIVFFTAGLTHAQEIQLLTSGAHSSFRGLCAVTDDIVWVSGSGGTVGKSLDGGRTWEWIVVPGYEKREFRDIEAFGKDTAFVMAIAEPASILQTSDGGKTWKEVYHNDAKGMFLDAMDFQNRQNGIVIGDPVDGHFFIVATTDGGKTWASPPAGPTADTGEACFASSGTNIRFTSANTASFITGGRRSRYVISIYKQSDLPLVQGAESTGANSFAAQGARIVVVGGDFAHDTARKGNCALSSDAGKTWKVPATPPHGYRSCVEFMGKGKLIACGTSGVDVSTDNGNTWQLIDKTGFHVCLKAKKGNKVFLAGGGGRVASLITF